jgi:3-oxoacyl-(acyl-carrier-protein) synthase
MDKLAIIAASLVKGEDAQTARLGTRFGRMDLSSQLALLAVEPLAKHFDAVPRHRIAIGLTASAGSLATDIEYWEGHKVVGGLSPTIFTYTLPSAAIGEIAIRHKLTGPNLCFVGGDAILPAEAGDLIRRGEADLCVCVFCDVISAATAEITGLPAQARAGALVLARGREGLALSLENGCGMMALCSKFCAQMQTIKSDHASLT